MAKVLELVRVEPEFKLKQPGSGVTTTILYRPDLTPVKTRTKLIYLQEV